MKTIREASIAPDFSLTDTRGAAVQLSAFRGKQPVVLVLMRGFV